MDSGVFPIRVQSEWTCNVYPPMFLGSSEIVVPNKIEGKLLTKISVNKKHKISLLVSCADILTPFKRISLNCPQITVH